MLSPNLFHIAYTTSTPEKQLVVDSSVLPDFTAEYIKSNPDFADKKGSLIFIAANFVVEAVDIESAIKEINELGIVDGESFFQQLSVYLQNHKPIPNLTEEIVNDKSEDTAHELTETEPESVLPVGVTPIRTMAADMDMVRNGDTVHTSSQADILQNQAENPIKKDTSRWELS